MNADVRAKANEAAFLEGAWELGELELRPFSLGSLVLARQMDLSLILGGGDVRGLNVEEVDRQLAILVWMQSATITEVLAAARDGTWKEAFSGSKFTREGYAAALLLDELRRVDVLTLAAVVSLVPKPGRSDEEPPQNMIAPSWIARRVFRIARGTGWSEDYILWHLPLPRALQYFHCSLWEDGAWTVEPSAPVSQRLEHLEAAAREMSAAESEDDEL